MLWLALLAYLLLAVRVRVSAAVSFCGQEGSLSLTAAALGIRFRRDARIGCEAGSVLPRVKPRYSERNAHRMPPGKRLKKLRDAKDYALPVLRACRLEEIALLLRLGDAGATAVAAGFARSVLCALVSVQKQRNACSLRVSADLLGEGFMLRARCIFSLQLGDIMFAALKAAVKKIGREGFGWKSIPLRA